MSKQYIFHSRHDHNRVTVVGEQRENGEFVFAAARCSNKDNFSRKRGRKIAEGRLTKGHIIASIPVDDMNIKTFVSTASEIADTVHNAAGPKRAIAGE